MYDIPKQAAPPVYITSAICLTDSKGRPTNRGLTTPEPQPGSVVLVEGPTGTAWQRWHRTGLWHKTGGSKPQPWDYLLQQANLVLAYSAPPRDF